MCSKLLVVVKKVYLFGFMFEGVLLPIVQWLQYVLSPFEWKCLVESLCGVLLVCHIDKRVLILS